MRIWEVTSVSSEFGKLLRVSVFGQSHGTAIGVTIDGLPAGEEIDLTELQAFLDRRRPGRSPLSTARKEGDVPEILSGLLDGKTCGAPLCAVIRNGDQHSGDYAELAGKPRPGHADYTAWVKWKGQADMRGGGHFSGRLTAPLCIAGGIAKQILARRGVYVGAHLRSIGNILDEPLPERPTADLFETIAAKPFPAVNDKNGAMMRQAIEQAKQELDSVGGVVECAAIGLPAGLGDPMFDGVENRLAAALFAVEDGRIAAVTNHAGGILGGITTGMPLILRAAFKPTPSIAREQRTVSLSGMENTTLQIHGRHDPCIAHRAVPVVEAVTACVLLDLLLEGNHGTF